MKFYVTWAKCNNFVSSEITPEENHSFVGGIGLAVNWASTSFYTCTFSTLHEMVGPWVQMYFIIPTIAIFIFTYRNLPETKGRPVDQIILTWVETDEKSELDLLLSGRKDSLVDSYGTIMWLLKILRNPKSCQLSNCASYRINTLYKTYGRRFRRQDKFVQIMEVTTTEFDCISQLNVRYKLHGMSLQVQVKFK